ncbi:ABC transporter substrate-binding protein [Neorhizobium alkalisoli]|uniref:Secreted protein n=1 Tax=Neorhizobium alkalisoli TaxID=528178 RepID=A0A561QGH5_9HYPH|nr:ABC transporter substrate-binding protein [Neorhizobium alkalisoli]TWF49401.1 secreted protein [Neorhizobium alkalisoli]
MTTRRSLLKHTAAIAAAGLFPMPAIVRAQALEQINVLTPFAFGASFIEMMNAVSGGHFAKQGLEVKLEAGRGGAQTLQQLVSDQTRFIRISSIEQIGAVEKSGEDLVCFSNLYQASTFHLVSLKSKPIKSAEELRGKTVGLVSVGGSTEIFLNLMLHKVGVPPAEVKREVTGDTPGALGILQQGRVDCFICSINVVAALRHMDAPVEIWSTDRYAPMPSQGYVAKRSVMEKNADQFVRISKALTASVNEIITQPTEMIYQRAAKDFQIPRMDKMDELVAITKATVDDLWLSQGKENLMRNVPALWASGVETLRDSKLTTATDPTKFYTNTYIDQALKG